MDLRTYKSMSLDDQRELMDRLQVWRELAESGCRDALDRMSKCEDFNNGDQWDQSLKAQLEAQGKYCATVPLIRPQVNQLVGNVVANPKDIQCVNTHGGMKLVADLNSALLKHAIDASDGLNLMAQWFHRGAITSRGFLAWFLDYSRDPINGDLAIRILPEFDCLWDPTCKSYDFNGTCGGGDAAKFFFYDDWVDQDWADQRWSEVSEEFEGEAAAKTGSLYHRVVRALYGVIGRDSERLSRRSTTDAPDYEAVRYRLQHCWWLSYEDGWYWYDNVRSKMEPVILTAKKDIAKAKKVTEQYPDSFTMIRSVVKVCHHTLSIGEQFLEDWVDEFSLATANLSAYPVVPYYPAHTWGRASGVVEDMIGPQESFNWLRSMVVNIIKLGPNHGWKIGQDIDNYSQFLREHSGEAGQVIDLSKCGGLAERLEPPPLPVGFHQVALESKGEIREVSNIRTESPEADANEMSGRAILAKQAGAQTGISPSLANFDWSMKIFGKVGMDIIRCSGVYGDDEIHAMIEESRLVDDSLLHESRSMVCASLGIQLPQQPPMPNPAKLQGASPQALASIGDMYQQEFETYQQLIAMIDAQAKPMAIQALIDAARNPAAGQYHTTVSLSPYSVTSRMSVMASVVETNKLLIESGSPPLPERDILEASDLPHKERILKERGYA